MADEPLTKRELEVVEHLASMPFRSQQEIGEDLGISQRTIRSHISNILAKTGMADQREIVLRELYRKMESKSLTMLSRSGNRRLAVVSREAVIPLETADAIAALAGSGDVVFVLTLDVKTVLAGLEGD